MLDTAYYVSEYQIKDLDSIGKLYEVAKTLPFSKDEYSVGGHLGEYRNFDKHKSSKSLVENVLREVELNMKHYLISKRISTISDSLIGLTMLGMKALSSLPIHTDEQIDSNMFYRNFVILIYLNDVEGGDLLLPNQKMSIRPAKGKMVVFPTGFMYPHGVNAPLDNRYTLRLNFGKMLKGSKDVNKSQKR